MFPPRIQYRYSQKLQISTVNIQNSYLTQVTLNNFAKTDHFWCLKNLRISNGQNVRFQEDQLIIQTDASSKNGEFIVQWSQKRGRGIRSRKSQLFVINIFELLAAKIGIFTFTKGTSAVSIHFQNGQEERPFPSCEDGGGGST